MGLVCMNEGSSFPHRTSTNPWVPSWSCSNRSDHSVDPRQPGWPSAGDTPPPSKHRPAPSHCLPTGRKAYLWLCGSGAQQTTHVLALPLDGANVMPKALLTLEELGRVQLAARVPDRHGHHVVEHLVE